MTRTARMTAGARAALLLSCGLFLAATGCTLKGYDEYELGPARQAVAGGVEWMGGLDAWKAVGEVHATAVVSVYDADGGADVTRQKQVIDVWDGSITASAPKAGGSWTKSAGPADLLDADGGMKRTLAIIAHRAAGPLNILSGRDAIAAGELKAVRVNGHDCIRVPVAGDDRRAKAYYFDAVTHLLRLVTTGEDRPGGNGTVTIYTYQRLPDGTAFPKTLRVVPIGRHVLIGDTPLITVEFSDVTLD